MEEEKHFGPRCPDEMAVLDMFGLGYIRTAKDGCNLLSRRFGGAAAAIVELYFVSRAVLAPNLHHNPHRHLSGHTS